MARRLEGFSPTLALLCVAVQLPLAQRNENPILLVSLSSSLSLYAAAHLKLQNSKYLDIAMVVTGDW